MNFGTSEHSLHKAPTDHLAPDTVELDLRKGEGALLEEMKPKTRYNIRLASRRGVQVVELGLDVLPSWHRLYEATAHRKGFHAQGLSYFRELFELARGHRVELKLYGAMHDGDLLGGIVVAQAGAAATYLYGASSDKKRELMAAYALQWEAMRRARSSGCSSYDLFGVPPAPDRAHPMFGLYRFKTGFGGRVVHRRGAWDFVFDEDAYRSYAAAESVDAGYYAS
jgi:lipid II:glycine glycyltransferase (peptidoglycan interpeptide bridge formation enzyme)